MSKYERQVAPPKFCVDCGAPMQLITEPLAAFDQTDGYRLTRERAVCTRPRRFWRRKHSTWTKSGGLWDIDWDWGEW